MTTPTHRGRGAHPRSNSSQAQASGPAAAVLPHSAPATPAGLCAGLAPRPLAAPRFRLILFCSPSQTREVRPRGALAELSAHPGSTNCRPRHPWCHRGGEGRSPGCSPHPAARLRTRTRRTPTPGRTEPRWESSPEAPTCVCLAMRCRQGSIEELRNPRLHHSTRTQQLWRPRLPARVGTR